MYQKRVVRGKVSVAASYCSSVEAEILAALVLATRIKGTHEIEDGYV